MQWQRCDIAKMGGAPAITDTDSDQPETQICIRISTVLMRMHIWIFGWSLSVSIVAGAPSILPSLVVCFSLFYTCFIAFSTLKLQIYCVFSYIFPDILHKNCPKLKKCEA